MKKISLLTLFTLFIFSISQSNIKFQIKSKIAYVGISEIAQISEVINKRIKFTNHRRN